MTDRTRDEGWVLVALCQNITQDPEGRVWWNGQKQQGLAPTVFLPYGSLWVCGLYGWPYLLPGGQSAVRGGGHTSLLVYDLH